MGYSATPDISEENKKFVQILSKNILIELSTRGRDATGYMAFYNGKTFYHKRPIPSERFILKGYYDLSVFPQSMIGHTRASTSGSPANNVNNHPILRDGFGIVHNGVIRSWDTLPKYADMKKKMLSKTDSELLAIKIEEDGNMEKIPEFFDEGSYAIAMMRRGSEEIHLIKDNNQPLVIADLTKIIGITLFASTQSIIEYAIKETFSKFPNFKVQYLDSYSLYKLSKGEISLVKDCSRKVKEEYAKEDNLIPFARWFKGETGGKYLINRVEACVRKIFMDTFGEKSYVGYLMKFADLYYRDGNDWRIRTLNEAKKLAENWIERQYELYGDDIIDVDEYVTRKYGRGGLVY
jgi:predicted glutamine amidotransferase